MVVHPRADARIRGGLEVNPYAIHTGRGTAVRVFGQSGQPGMIGWRKASSSLDARIYENQSV